MKKAKLDKEEQEILDSFERGEWKSVKNLKREIERHQAYARNTLKKDRRVNIRISSKDLEEIQSIAVADGLPTKHSCPVFSTSLSTAGLSNQQAEPRHPAYAVNRAADARR